MSILAIITALIQAVLQALGLIKKLTPSESEKEDSEKAALDKEISEADETGRP